jgi:hypothetical protein
MRVGMSIPGDPDLANDEAVALLTGCGVRSVFIECHEETQDTHGLALAGFARRSRREGLEVYAVPRGYGHVLRSPRPTRTLYLRGRREAQQIDSKGRRAPCACPNNREFVEWFAARMADLAEMLACDGFVWDEPAFYFSRGAWGCRCDECQRLYEWQYGEELPTELTFSAAHFRRRAIVMFLLAVAARVKRVNAACQCIVMSAGELAHEQFHTGTQQWSELLDSSGVDGLAAFPDWRRRGTPLEDALAHLGRSALREARLRGKRGQVWIAGSPQHEDRLLDALRFAARLGAPEFVIVDYASLVRAAEFAAFRPRLEAAIRDVSAKQQPA